MTPPLAPFTICALPLLIFLAHTIRGLVLSLRALRSCNAAERFHRNTHCALHLEAWDPWAPEREAALVAARELCCATWAWAPSRVDAWQVPNGAAISAICDEVTLSWTARKSAADAARGRPTGERTTSPSFAGSPSLLHHGQPRSSMSATGAERGHPPGGGGGSAERRPHAGSTAAPPAGSSLAPDGGGGSGVRCPHGGSSAEPRGNNIEEERARITCVLDLGAGRGFWSLLVARELRSRGFTVRHSLDPAAGDSRLEGGGGDSASVVWEAPFMEGGAPFMAGEEPLMEGGSAVMEGEAPSSRTTGADPSGFTGYEQTGDPRAGTDPRAGGCSRGGAGRGGVEVLAVDANCAWYPEAARHFPLRQGGLSEASRELADPATLLLLVWPPCWSPMAVEALGAYRGGVLAYVGEEEGGKTASKAFFQRLRDEWRPVREVTIPTWRGCADRLTIYHRVK
ncbi:hypothetical protein T484DRAFT_2017086 [Baffinella frigidus]|nr:hypothetical protein T484DRAFT_2017086 [Cryptophyta sp. CCMP2293]